MGPKNTKNSSLVCGFLIINYEILSESCFNCKKDTNDDQKTVSLL